MTAGEKRAYKQGYIDGLTCFAHWKDGQEYVGTMRTTLKEAIRVCETQWNYLTRGTEERLSHDT